MFPNPGFFLHRKCRKIYILENEPGAGLNCLMGQIWPAGLRLPMSASVTEATKRSNTH